MLGEISFEAYSSISVTRISKSNAETLASIIYNCQIEQIQISRLKEEKWLLPEISHWFSSLQLYSWFPLWLCLLRGKQCKNVRLSWWICLPYTLTRMIRLTLSRNVVHLLRTTKMHLLVTIWKLLLVPTSFDLSSFIVNKLLIVNVSGKVDVVATVSKG